MPQLFDKNNAFSYISPSKCLKEGERLERELCISRETIQQRVLALAEEISSDYEGRSPF
jgi:hypothetical protein